MVSASKNYEIAYLLSPALSEDEVSVLTGKLSKVIEDASGIVRRIEIPKKRSLAYAVAKGRTAYFGWTTFAADSAAVREIKKRADVLEGILREQITEEIEVPQRQFLRTIPSRQMTGVNDSATPAVPRAEEKEERLDLEALDKKLEEILGK